ncbi:hypothetical protein [Anaeromyxobacter paludicola]|uniref:Uncharacterized protein n=1 Tax=Anaeromyxobacter paludicola TaxID=2918171 RepID=A0ABN6N7P4_9BACT|nr:hypothetical protein [Anaeromyxobacter paludicola]BDG09192.1 hypothetical protein AMPC_23050 [Anaeromyxobacter paludicola]
MSTHPNRSLATLAAAVALLSAAPALAAPAAAAPATAQERFPALVKAAEDLRGLKFTHPVKVRVEKAEQIKAMVDRKVREVPKARWDRELAALKALELLPADVTDLAATTAAMLSGQVVAYYDEEQDVLVLGEEPPVPPPPAGAPKPDAAAEAREKSDRDAARNLVVVHELVHALQAQHLGLAKLLAASREEPAQGDADEAVPLLLEGDASLSMLRANAPQLDLDAVPALVQAMRAGRQAGLEDVPPYLSESLLAAYADGMLLCAALLRSGGPELLDRAFSAPPASTEQALHPEKYFAGELPAHVKLPADDSVLRSRHFEKKAERSLGELGIRIWAGLWASRETGAEAAAGWNGDRYALYEKAGEAPALLWLTSWDTDADAAEFESSAAAVQAHRGPQLRSSGCRVYQRGARSDALCRNGRQVALVRDAPGDLAAFLSEQLAAVIPAAVPPRPPLPGAVYTPAAHGQVETSRGREEGRHYVHERLAFALTRPESPALRFEDGPTSTGLQFTPVILASPRGDLQLRVTVLPQPLLVKDVAERLAGGLASKLPAGKVSKSNAEKRGDGREAWAVRYAGKGSAGRVLAVAGEGRTYVLSAGWSDKAPGQGIQALIQSQDGLDVLGAKTEKAAAPASAAGAAK